MQQHEALTLAAGTKRLEMKTTAQLVDSSAKSVLKKTSTVYTQISLEKGTLTIFIATFLFTTLRFMVENKSRKIAC